MSQDNFNVLDVETLLDECLIAKKIYGRCKQQDCLKPVDYDTPILPANYIKIDSSLSGEKVDVTGDFFDGTIEPNETIKITSTVKSVELVQPFATDIKVIKVAPPGPFSLPGFYDVTIQYTFTYHLSFYDVDNNKLSFLIGTTTATEMCGYAIYTKMISLEGGVVDSNTVVSICDTGIEPSHSFVNPGNLPYAYVQAIASPLLTKIGRYLTNPGQPTPVFEYHVDVVIGLFTIIELYRINNMSVASNGPIEVPQCQASITTDPCVGFNQLLFPYDDFDPPYRKC